jgi:hypothetical protein
MLGGVNGRNSEKLSLIRADLLATLFEVADKLLRVREAGCGVAGARVVKRLIYRINLDLGCLFFQILVLGGQLLDHKLAPSAHYLGLDEVGLADGAGLFVCGRNLGSKDICWGVLQLIAVVDLSRVAANNF